MPIETTYTCDHSGRSCSDSDILADDTNQTMRVVLDATIYHKSADGLVPVVAAKSMGQHVFASIEDALAWAQGISV